MKPKTRFYICVTFLLLSVLCLGGTLVVCMIDRQPKNFLTALIFLACSVTFFQVIRQMIDLRD